MNVEIQHSIIQDMTIIKFNSLHEYRRVLEFLDESMLSWTPLKYSSKNDTASIRIDEHVLTIITEKFGIGKTCQY